MSLFIYGCAAGFLISTIAGLWYTAKETKDEARFTSEQSRSIYRRRKKSNIDVKIEFAADKQMNKG